MVEEQNWYCYVAYGIAICGRSIWKDLLKIRTDVKAKPGLNAQKMYKVANVFVACCICLCFID